MRTIEEIYRRGDTLERPSLPPGRGDLAWITEAKLSSKIIVAAIERAGVTPESAESRPLSFDEQLAAVSRGARIVTMRPIRKADPDYTLGGVCW